MRTLLELRDITLNKLGITQTSSPLTEITNDPVTYLNSEINSVYRYQIANEYCFLPELKRISEILLSKNQIFIDLKKISKVYSIYLQGRLLVNYNEANIDFFCKPKLYSQILLNVATDKIYSEDLISQETFFVRDQSGVVIAKCDTEFNLRSQSDNSIVGKLVSSNFNTYQIQSTQISGSVEVLYKTIPTTHPSMYSRYNNTIYKLNSAISKDAIITVKGSIRPDPLVTDADTTIFLSNDVDMLICIDVALNIARRLFNEEKVSVLQEERDILTNKVNISL